MQIDYADKPTPTVEVPSKGGKIFPFLRGETYLANQVDLPDPIWEWLGGREPQKPDKNGLCSSILLQEALDAANPMPAQMAVEPQEQQKQLENVEDPNPAPSVQAVQKCREY